MLKKKIILVIGPTASGKTDRAIDIALQTGSEIISADSRQIYRELDIGVARPTAEQLSRVKHHFIACESIYNDYNAGNFARDARMCINALFRQSNTVVVCGGTGLYIKALLKGLDPLPGKNETLRSELSELLESKGISVLQIRLKMLDPHRWETIDRDNPQRLIRAIEIALSPIPEKTELPAFDFAFDLETVFLNPDRTELYERINRRVDVMVSNGLEQEVAALYPLRHLNALQTVGYSEWWPYFEGKAERKEAIEKIKQHSRNYAKRQLTWFKHQGLL